MVKFISRLGGLFGGDQKKPRKAAVSKRSTPAKPARKTAPRHARPVKAGARPAKPAKKVVQKPKPVKSAKRPVLKAVVKLPPKQKAEAERSVILFITPTCPDCAAARKLVAEVRRVVRNVVFREVDLSTRDGELEGLLNGIVDAPAFVINGRPVFRGVLPSREQLARIINEGASP